jgi:hypothetical protein
LFKDAEEKTLKTMAWLIEKSRFSGIFRIESPKRNKLLTLNISTQTFFSELNDQS